MLRTGTDVLGPGKRVILWVHGCTRNCPGCIAAGWNGEEAKDALSVTTLTSRILLEEDLTGITISGGEPFLQAEALSMLLTEIRARRELNVIVYTGYLLEEIPALPNGKQLLSQIDALIDGEYKKELDLNEGWRGSTNQRLHLFGDRLTREQIFTMKRTRTIEIDGTDGRIVGIPDHALTEAWTRLKAASAKQHEDC